MATSPLGSLPSFANIPQATPINPLQALLGGFQQGVGLAQLPQKLENDALNQQLAVALQQAKLQQLAQGSVENVGGRLVRYNPQTGKVEVLLDAAPAAVGPETAQFIGYDANGQPISYLPRSNAFTQPKIPEGMTFSGPLAPKTVSPETFSTVVSDQGLMRAGNRSTTAVPLTVGETQVQAPAKPATVSRFTDANGFLFQQSSTGGPATPVLDEQGSPINAGVANRIIESDQGIMSVPTKASGTPTATPVSTSSGLAPGTPLTKTKAGSQESQAATKQFINELTDTAISTIDELKPRISNTTVGLGSYLSGIRGTDAAGFDARVQSLTSDIKLGVLQQMKSISKTGASGLGALSDKEGKSLESALGSLNTAQNPQDFKKSLEKVESSIKRWKTGVEKFGIPTTEGATPSGPQKIGRFTVTPQ